MRPQDIAILLKIIALGNNEWQLSTLSHSLKISLSEISESLNRSRIAGLLTNDKKMVNRKNLFDFLHYGVKYVFPVQPGPVVRGVPTAHAHPSLREKFISNIEYVWPHFNGTTIGQVIEPFYHAQAEAITSDLHFYELLALVDMIRVGKAREVEYAVKQLENHLLTNPHSSYYAIS